MAMGSSYAPIGQSWINKVPDAWSTVSRTMSSLQRIESKGRAILCYEPRRKVVSMMFSFPRFLFQVHASGAGPLHRLLQGALVYTLQRAP